MKFTNVLPKQIIILLLLCITGNLFSQAFRKEFTLNYSGMIEQSAQIGKNRFAMAFKDYICVIDSDLNVIKTLQGNGISSLGYPKVGIVKVKDGVIFGNTDNSYTAGQFIKFNNDLSQVIVTKQCNFGSYGLSSFDLNFFLQDSTTKNATFIGGYNSCTEVVIAHLDSVLNVTSAKSVSYISSTSKRFVDYTKLNNTLYLLHYETGNSTGNSSYILKTSMSGNIQKAFYVSVGDSLTNGLRVIKTSDNNLLLTGRAYYKNQTAPKQYVMKCDTNGVVQWCQSISCGSLAVNFIGTITEVNSKYYLGGSVGNFNATDVEGLILELNPNGSITNYKAYGEAFPFTQFYWKEIAGVTKFNQKQIIAVNDMAVLRFFDTNIPTDMESCKTAVHNFTVNNLTPTITVIPNNLVFTNNASLIASTVTSPAINLMNNQVTTPCQNVPTGMEEVKNDMKAELYPNPVENNLTIKALAIKKINILNLTGEQVMTKIIDMKEAAIDLSFLTPGIYLIRLETASGVILKKIVKK